MSNVLSSAARQGIARALSARTVLMGALLVSLAALVSLLALVPAFLSVAIPLVSERVEMSSAEKEQAAQYEESRKEAAKTRVTLAVLDPFTVDRISPRALIERIYSMRPEGVMIYTIEYQTGAPGQIVITGQSKAREPVNNFRSALIDAKLFDSVSVPVAALVGALEGNFSMTLSGTF